MPPHVKVGFSWFRLLERRYGGTRVVGEELAGRSNENT